MINDRLSNIKFEISISTKKVLQILKFVMNYFWRNDVLHIYIYIYSKWLKYFKISNKLFLENNVSMVTNQRWL